MSSEPANRQEIAVLARRAGLKLTDDHFEELVEAYSYVEQMLIRLRRGRSYDCFTLVMEIGVAAPSERTPEMGLQHRLGILS